MPEAGFITKALLLELMENIRSNVAAILAPFPASLHSSNFITLSIISFNKYLRNINPSFLKEVDRVGVPGRPKVQLLLLVS
jgi:hypothetical protein